MGNDIDGGTPYVDPNAPVDTGVVTLHDLLAQTMLRTASPASSLLVGYPSEPQNFHQWNYTSLIGADRPQLSNVTCYSEQFSMATTVCESIAWGDVVVTANGQQVTLPLTGDYYIGYYLCQNGNIAENETDPFWRLAATIEHGFMLVYAYDITSGSAAIVPSSFSTDALNDFLPNQNSSPQSQKVVVAVSFMGCTPREDFEPAGVLNAARMYPLTYVLSNTGIDSAACRITVKRPVNRMVMDGVMDDMTQTLGMALFTDRNVNEFYVRPEWEFIFDYYDTYPATDMPFKAVDNSKTGSRDDSFNRTVLGLNLGNPEYVNKTVTKIARQGEFDNLHIAPRYADAGTMSNLTGTVMAPVCQHDCFHTHWRWSVQFDVKQTRGWSANGPHSQAGAPMIPPNQELTITLTSDRPGFIYDATASNIPGGVLQVFNHHGSAYAIATDSLALSGAVLTSGGWRDFYHGLRYSTVNGTEYENVRLYGEHSMDALRHL